MHEVMNDIKQQPPLETGASITSNSVEQNNNNTGGSKASVFSVEDLTTGTDGQISPPVKDQSPPSLPKRAPADEIKLALLELARTNTSGIELDLALNQLHTTTTVKLKTLTAELAQIKTELDQQQARPELTEEQRAAQEQAEREKATQQQEWQQKVERRAKEIAASSDLVADLQAALKDCHGYLASESLAGTILVSHGARLLPRSMGFVFSGPSSSGKSDGVIRASDCLPPEVVMTSTSFSEKSLYYLGSIAGKYILGGEIKADKPGEDDPLQQAFRQLMSENKITRTTVEHDETGKLVTVVHETSGPVVFTLTTTKELQEFNDEFANRLTWHATSDDPELTEAVLHAQAESATRPPGATPKSINDLEIEAWQTYHRNLKPLNVVVPYAKQIVPQSREVTIRRLYPMVLNYIKALALLHQASRPVVENGSNPYVVASLEEYQIAYKLITANAPRVLDILSKRDRDMYAKLSVTFAGQDFRKTQAQTFLKLTGSKAGRILKDLTDAGCLTVVPGQGKAYLYRLADGNLVLQDLGLIPPEHVAIESSLHDGGKLVGR